MKKLTNEERLQRLGVVITSVRICFECGRNFLMTDEIDAQEWAYGHDCGIDAEEVLS